jgi:hypothetical protein
MGIPGAPSHLDFGVLSIAGFPGTPSGFWRSQYSGISRYMLRQQANISWGYQRFLALAHSVRWRSQYRTGSYIVKIKVAGYLNPTNISVAMACRSGRGFAAVRVALVPRWLKRYNDLTLSYSTSGIQRPMLHSSTPVLVSILSKIKSDLSWLNW